MSVFPPSDFKETGWPGDDINVLNRRIQSLEEECARWRKWYYELEERHKIVFADRDYFKKWNSSLRGQITRLKNKIASMA